MQDPLPIDLPVAPSYQALGSYIDLLLDLICVVDASGRFVYVSASVSRILGYSNTELLGQAMLDYVWPADRERTLAQAAKVMSGEAGMHFENRYRHKDGHAVHLSWSARWSDAEQVRVAVARDISDIRQAQARQRAVYAIAEAAQLSADLSDLYQHVVVIVAELLPVRHFFIALPEPDSSRWQLCYQQHWPQDRQQSTAELADLDRLCQRVAQKTSSDKLAEGIGNGWFGLPLKDGSDLLGVLLLHPGEGVHYSAADLELLSYVTVQITAAISRKTMLLRLQQLALYDSLTGLANRTLLLDRLQAALQRASRDEQPLALLYLDLDRFKQVNDNFGHPVGDLLLQQTAERIVHAVRQTDTVARFGGDEFVILLEHLHQQDTAAKVAEKIRSALTAPFLLAGRQLQIAPSIGIALFPDHGSDSRQLLLHADGAMYRAKRHGGDRVE
jgi:diguanylate cyclase (GGDEF)-like protein/PAS domain S-box-containing protein